MHRYLNIFGLGIQMLLILLFLYTCAAQTVDFEASEDPYSPNDQRWHIFIWDFPGCAMSMCAAWPRQSKRDASGRAQIPAHVLHRWAGPAQ